MLDASATAAWCLLDEATPESAALRESLDAGARAVVPPLWLWEVANLLAMSMWRGRLSEADMHAATTMLKAMPIEIDADSADRTWSATLGIARKHNLTAYDASYLELSLRRGFPLATKHSGLARAASAEGVPLLLAA